MHKKIIFGLAICWTFLIAFLCLVKFNDLPNLGVSGVDKYVHFTLHFVFTGLWGYYSWVKQNKVEIIRMISIVVISIFYGILIEFLQENYTDTRHADIKDVLANFTGSAIAFISIVIVGKRNFKN